MCGSGLPDANWMPTSGLVLGNCGLFGILLVCTASLSLCQPNSANGQYLQSSQNCHQPSVTSVIRHYHRLSLFSLSKRASEGRHALQ